MPAIIIQDIVDIEQLKKDIKANEEYQKTSREIIKKILETKLKYLTVLREYYQKHLLAFGVKEFEAEIEATVTKAEFLTQEFRKKKMNEKLQRLKTEKGPLKEKISAAENRIDKFRSLDPTLLSEYQKLKDDLECQDMLIQFSEANADEEGSPHFAL